MNAAIALHGDYAYIGNRSDGSHPNGGVLVVDISNPANPQVVDQIGPPEEGNVGETSRELRVWPAQELLIILNFRCGAGRACVSDPSISTTIKFYDISGPFASRPSLVATYFPSRNPHEFFLWADPFFRSRALLYMSTPSGIRDNILVTDISGARDGVFDEITSWRADFLPPQAGGRLHSLSVSVYGDRAYLAYLQSGFFVVDTSEIAARLPDPEIKLVAPLATRVFWPGPGPHSAVKVFNSRYVMVSDEVYGSRSGGGHGCPWGWVRMIDIRNEQQPEVVAEYRIDPYNDPDFCTTEENTPDRDRLSSFSSHNPTVLKNLAFITWHSAGLQAIVINNPTEPQQAAEFKPQPLPFVQTEGPALSSGIDKVVMWSYPVIKDGLIYVVDLRNGLYILRYHGRFAADVARIGFLEGNSNLGDAVALEASIGRKPLPIHEWLGVDGEPLPFKDDAEIKDFLVNAEVTEQEDIPVGLTDPIRLTLEKDGITAHAVYRSLETVYPRVRSRRHGVRVNLKGSSKFEAAAYELSRVLEMDNVPPTVVRRVGSDTGTLQIRVYNSMMESERFRQEMKPPNRLAYMQQVQMMYLFDALIGNDDRTQENILIDKNWKLWLIDHTRAFYPLAKFQNLDRVIHVDRAFWEELQALNRASLGDVLGDYLTASEIDKIMERREPLVELIQGLIDSRGEEAVLYDWVPLERQ